MKAKKLGKGEQIYGSRSILAEQLPLSTPFVVQISPASICNFSCNYCMFSNETAFSRYTVAPSVMKPEIHKKIADNLNSFPEKIKKLIYVGYGEPLINKNLPEMIRYSYDLGIAENIDIITNGSLLTKDMSDRLFTSGLSALRVSLQGVNSDDYQRVAGAEINFDTFLEQLRYFASNKPDTITLYVKIVDSALTVSEDEFYQLYGDIADIITVECTLPMVADIDYSQVTKSSEANKTLRGDEYVVHEICPQPFYQMLIQPNGDAAPCCNFESPLYFGNTAQETSVEKLWNSTVLTQFRLEMLQGVSNEICSRCQTYQHLMFKEDSLDAHRETLITTYRNQL